MGQWDFLLIRQSNLGLSFGDIAGFFVLLSDPPLFHPNFGVFLLNQMDVGSTRAEALSYSAVKLFSKYANLCDHGPERHRQTDRRHTVA